MKTINHRWQAKKESFYFLLAGCAIFAVVLVLRVLTDAEEWWHAHHIQNNRKLET